MGKLGGILEVLLGLFLLGAGFGLIEDYLDHVVITFLEIAAGFLCIYLGLVKYRAC
ncbi:MAG TPA: hypothetical protein P5217_07645 [Methanoregulaceae archaeon]|nr:hypothetical protein [Methanoregulaceae archaeon]HPD76216.1 hypothetical protein [Methanoregulaceae archaeon]HRY76141.1 hypothetical protein [Methanoregulaceae archaeon]